MKKGKKKEVKSEERKGGYRSALEKIRDKEGRDRDRKEREKEWRQEGKKGNKLSKNVEKAIMMKRT